MDLQGQTAVITRAESRFAVPLAEALLDSGASVFAVTADPDGARRVGRALGGRATVESVDATDDAIQSFAHRIATDQGAVEILITLPAEIPVSPATNTSTDNFREALTGSLVHVYQWCHVVGAMMVRARGGVIVNVTGLDGLGGWSGGAASGAALAGIHNLSQALAVEWAPLSVRVNCLVPGADETVQDRLSNSHIEISAADVVNRIPAGRLVTTTDLQNALLYLVNPAASFVTGEILRVDGGWDIWGRLYPAARG